MKICESFFSLRNTQNYRLNKENYISFKITLKLSLLHSKQTISTTQYEHFVKTFFLLISVNLLKCRSKRDVDRPRLHIMMTYVGCWMEIISIVRVGIFNVQLKKKKKRLNYFFSKKNFLNFFYQTFPHLSLKYTDTFR